MVVKMGTKQIILSGNPANWVLWPATAGQRVRLLALAASSEAAAADIVIRDTGAVNIGGIHHIGKGTALDHGDGIVLPFNPAGWCETGSGKGLVINNEDTATIDGVATIEVRQTTGI